MKSQKNIVNFDSEEKDLKQILEDKSNDKDIIEMAEKDLDEMKLLKKKVMKINLKYFYSQKMRTMIKML